MGNNLSKTQIDKLGDRLRKGDISDEDLRALSDYRLSFSDAYEFVIGSIQNELALEPTGRPAKSTNAIIEKLLRESIRLSQIQDIAGCRIVVRGLAEQNRAVTDLTTLFENATMSIGERGQAMAIEQSMLLLRKTPNLLRFKFAPRYSTNGQNFLRRRLTSIRK